tara:strand:- start:306 stop:4865 length:4560 start_codon:yes stop_codon:yes gene_type:complete
MSFPPQINEASDFSKINGQRLSMSLVPNFTVDEKKIVDDVVEEQEQQLLNIAIQRFSPEQIKEWQNNPIGWSEANKFIEAADIVPGGGLIKGYEALELSALAKKRANNEELSESENEQFNQFLDKYIEKNIRGFSWGGGMKYYGAPLPAFITEFFLTGGIGKTAQTAAVKSLEKTAEFAAVKSATTEVAGAAANVAARSAAMIPMNVRNAGETTLTQQVGLTQDGVAILKDAELKPATTALKAFAYTNAELASEISGARLGKYIIDPVTNKISTSAYTAINTLSPRLLTGLLNTFREFVKPNATMQEIITRAGWHGMLNELGEERVADALRLYVDAGFGETLTVDQVWDTLVPSKDQFLIEAGLIGTLGGVKTTVVAIDKFINQDNKTPENTQDADDLLTNEEREAVLEDNLTIEPNVEIVSDINNKLLNQYEETANDPIEKKRDKVIRSLEKDVELIRKQATTFKDFIASGGALNTEELVRQGFDPEIFKSRSLATAKDFKRVFAKNGQQTLSDLTERYNERMNLFDPNARTGSSQDRALDDNDMLDLLGVLFNGNDNFILEADLNGQINEINAEVADLAQMDASNLENYFFETYKDVAETNDNLVPVFNEANEIVFADNLDEAAYNIYLDEFNDYVNETDGLVKSSEYIRPLFSNFVDIPKTKQNEVPAAQIDNTQNTFASFYRLFVDKFDGVNRLVKKALERGASIKEGLNPTLLISSFSGITGMSKYVLENKTFYIDERGNKIDTGNGLKPILDDFDATIIPYEKDQNARRQDLIDYLIARRSLNDLQEDKKVTDAQVEKSLSDMANITAKYGDAIEFFDSTAKEIYEFQKRILNLFVQSGNLTGKQFEDIIKANPNYIPFQRILDENTEQLSGNVGGALFSNKSAKSIIKKLVGSEKEIKDPINSIIANTVKIMDISYRNRVANSVVALKDVLPEYIQPVKPLMQKFMVDGKEVFRPSPLEPKGTIAVYQDGKKKFFKVSKPLLQAMKGLRAEQIGFLQKFFIVPSFIFRRAATTTIDFVVRNLIRDSFTSSLQSKNISTPIDTVRGLTAIMGDTQLYQDWRASGASYGTYMDLSDSGLYDANKDLYKNEGYFIKTLKNPLKPFFDISQKAEESVRVGVYLANKKNGLSDLAAALESRQATVDFGRSGVIGQRLNRYIPFLNAGIQGTDKLVRRFLDNPKTATAIALSTITLPSILITGYYLYEADDDEREEYLNIPQWLKDTHWVYKTKDGWKRIPKPFAPGYIFGSIPEKFMVWMYEGNKPQGQNFYTDIGKGMLSSLSPVVDPTVLLGPLPKLGVEIAANYDFFTGRDIYPEYLDKLEPELRATRYTSELSKEAGKAFNISPVMIDKVLQSTIPNTERYVTAAADKIINEIKEFNNVEVSEKAKSGMNNPIIRSFLVSPPRSPNSQYVQNMFDIADQVQMKVNSAKKYKGDKLRLYKKDNQILFQFENTISRSLRNYRKITKQKNEMLESTVLSGEEKTKRQEAFDKKLFNIAESTVTKFSKRINEIERDK